MNMQTKKHQEVLVSYLVLEYGINDSTQRYKIQKNKLYNSFTINAKLVFLILMRAKNLNIFKIQINGNLSCKNSHLVCVIFIQIHGNPMKKSLVFEK
jgi:hypothetical protein